MAAAAEPFRALVDSAAPQFSTPGARRGFLGSAGRYLLMLGDETHGARLVHRAAQDMPVPGATHSARLYSRPAPEAALWLRQAIDRASRYGGEGRDAVLQQATCALLALAGRHHARHVLRETLEPLTVRFNRPDVTALVLVTGAPAWLACGERWQGQDWLLAGLRLAGRHLRTPLALETLLQATRWLDRVPDEAVTGMLAGYAEKLTQDGRVALGAALARLAGQRGHQEAAWTRLAGLYRLARSRHHEGHAEPVLACAEALLAWGQAAPGLGLVRRALNPGEGGTKLPAQLGGTGTSVEEERAALLAVIDKGLRAAEPGVDAVRVLLRRGETGLAITLHAAVRELVDAEEDPRTGIRLALLLARRVAEGIDLPLRGQVEAAVEEEAAMILERLRVDDPPLGR
jgi:hypothetical protein